MSEILLQLENLSVSYGQHRALSKVSLKVKRGEIVSLLGANGAGKTTLLLAVMRMMKISGGTISYLGNSNWSNTASLVRSRCVLVPEGRRILTTMTIEDNLLLGVTTRRDRTDVAAHLNEVYSQMSNLAEKRHQLAAVLSGGEQQMLALGRAMMARPELLLLDEPSLGLSPSMTNKVFQIISQLNLEGTSILMVEQNARAALDLSSRAYVLRLGRMSPSQTADSLRVNGALEAAYLGKLPA